MQGGFLKKFSLLFRPSDPNGSAPAETLLALDEKRARPAKPRPHRDAQRIESYGKRPRRLDEAAARAAMRTRPADGAAAAAGRRGPAAPGARRPDRSGAVRLVRPRGPAADRELACKAADRDAERGSAAIQQHVRELAGAAAHEQLDGLIK